MPFGGASSGPHLFCRQTELGASARDTMSTLFGATGAVACSFRRSLRMKISSKCAEAGSVRPLSWSIAQMRSAPAIKSFRSGQGFATHLL
jgi:hypothetical protein